MSIFARRPEPEPGNEAVPNTRTDIHYFHPHIDIRAGWEEVSRVSDVRIVDGWPVGTITRVMRQVVEPGDAQQVRRNVTTTFDKDVTP